MRETVFTRGDESESVCVARVGENGGAGARRWGDAVGGEKARLGWKVLSYCCAFPAALWLRVRETLDASQRKPFPIWFLLDFRAPGQGVST